MAKDHGPSVKDDEQYEALRRQGESKEKAARIANAGDRSETGSKGGQSPPYEEWSVDEATPARGGDRHRGTLGDEQG
jgi:hypothetical protein